MENKNTTIGATMEYVIKRNKKKEKGSRDYLNLMEVKR